MISDDEIRESYATGLNRDQVARSLCISGKRVRKVLAGCFRKRSEYQFFINQRNEHPLTEQKLQCILGSLLGDSSISMNRGIPVLSCSHCSAQRGYLEHKQRIIGAPPVYSGVRDEGSYNEGETYFRLSYSNRACLDKIWSIVTVNGKKRVNQMWLDRLKPEGIAFWFMDDGSSTFVPLKYPKVRTRFSTLGFDQIENEMLMSKLQSYGLKTSLHRRREGFKHEISISERSTVEFMNLIKNYIHSTMQYKIKFPTYKHQI